MKEAYDSGTVGDEVLGKRRVWERREGWLETQGVAYQKVAVKATPPPCLPR